MRNEYKCVSGWRNIAAPILWNALTKPSSTDSTHTDRTEAMNDALASLHLNAEVVGIKQGPVITRYMVKVGDGIRVRNVRNNLEDLAMRLGVPCKSIRIECNDGLVGIEVPNETRSVVPCRTIVTPDNSGLIQFGSLNIGMGVDIVGNPVHFNLAKAPHMLVAGQTGSGKSVFLNSLICNLLMNNHPNELSLVLIDPKGTEMQSYAAIPTVQVINNVRDAVKKLASLVDVMEARYRMFTEATVSCGKPVRTLDDYMETVTDYTRDISNRCRIVVVIDEVADLMACDKQGMETSIARLAAKARAAGIHLVLATQRPSRDVITGTIKANLPTRIAFRLPSQVDSKTILDEIGAESLLGRGDMLFKTTDGVTRLHGCWMSDNDIMNFINMYKQIYSIINRRTNEKSV